MEDAGAVAGDEAITSVRAVGRTTIRRAASRLRMAARGDPAALVLRTALGLAGLATLLYSAPLWRAHALPPQVPPFGWSPPGALDGVSDALALASLVALVVLPVPFVRAAARITAACALLFAVPVLSLALGDQHRWQPEIQMFVLFALGLALATRGPGARVAALALLRLYVTTVYLYSGLQKLNPSFTHDAAPWLLQPPLGWLQLGPFVARHDLWVPLGLAMAATEASLAVLLWLPPTRRLGVALAVTMHVSLLLILGPPGHDWNAVIWPWNGFMIVVVPALFWNERGWFVRPLFPKPLPAAAACALLLYPAGHALGVVDVYPAHNLYSNFSGVSLTCLPPGIFLSEPATWRRELVLAVQLVDGRPWDCVNDLGWYVNRLGVPPYNAFRVQAAVAVAACDELRAPDALLLERDQPPLFHPAAQPFRGWNRVYRGCKAIRRHARAGLLGGVPR